MLPRARSRSATVAAFVAGIGFMLVVAARHADAMLTPLECEREAAYVIGEGSCMPVEAPCTASSSSSTAGGAEQSCRRRAS